MSHVVDLGARLTKPYIRFAERISAQLATSSFKRSGAGSYESQFNDRGFATCRASLSKPIPHRSS
jgi:hypothetical protein